MIGEDFNADGVGVGSDLAAPEPPVRVADAASGAPPPVTSAPAQPSPLAGLSPNYRDVVGQLESSGGTQIGNGGGKYQFMPGTAKQYGGSDDTAMDRFTTDNVKALSKAGVPVNDVTAYVAHQQGGGGASKLLTAAPDAIAADVVGAKNAMGNKPYFYAKDGTPLTVAQSIDVFNNRVKNAGSKASAIVPTAAPGAPAEVNALDKPKTMGERLKAWAKEYVTPDTQQAQGEAKPAAEDEDTTRARLKESELPAVAAVPLGQPTSGVVRSGGKVLFQRYGRTFDAHGNLVG